MKKIFIVVLAAFMLCLCACGNIQESFQLQELPGKINPINPTSPEPTTDNSADPAEPTEAPVPTETEAPVTEPPVSIVDTKYYTLTLPADWIGKVLCDLHERDDGSYSISVHEIQDFLDFGGGKLFTLMMLPTSEDYTIFPSYELLCALDTPAGNFYVVALFPTDVQSSEENRDTYFALNDQVQDVLYTIAPKDGIEMAMP